MEEEGAEPVARMSAVRNRLIQPPQNQRAISRTSPRDSRGGGGGSRRTCSCYLATQYGSKLVRQVMQRLNWPEATDSAILSSPNAQQPQAAPPLTLIWCNGCQADLFIRKMRPGQHIVSRLPGTRCLTNKLLLPETLRAQDAAPQCRCRDHPRLTADTVLPATFVLRTAMQRLQFLRRMSSDSGSLWICKPATLNRGEGIKLVRAELDFRNLFNDERTSGEPRRDWVIQKYIERPLLLAGKKFDLRVYLLVLATLNLNCLAFYHPGYARLTCRDFDLKSDDLCLHLTNQAVQQKDSTYDSAREETIWSIDRLNGHVNERCEEYGSLAKDFVISGMQVSIRQALAHLVAATRPKLATACGCFELFGCDFLVEESGKVWLLELNSTPALGVYNSTQEAIIPGVVHEALAIAAEAFDRVFRRQPVLPLSEQQKQFQLIYDSSSRPRQPRPTLVERQQKAAGGQLGSRARSMPALNLLSAAGMSSAKSTDNLHLNRPATAPLQQQVQQQQQKTPVLQQRRQRGAVAARLQKAKSSLALTQASPLGNRKAAVVKSMGNF